MLTCFEDRDLAEKLDRESFKFEHKLLGHTALSLENLEKVLPALPRDRVLYSTKSMKIGDNFEKSFGDRSKKDSIEKIIGEIKISDSYIMISQPEIDPSFKDLYRELVNDVETLMRQRGVGNHAIDPQLYLFIASPNSVTPFHIDRYSTFLMQFRGSKEVCVFPAWDERVVTSADREAYITYQNTKLPWSEQIDTLATKYIFHPGEAIHIPFVAGHHVRNGSDDVSISMSIIFNTAQTMMWRKALAFNHTSRSVLKRFGIAPTPVGIDPWRDTTKSYLNRPISLSNKLVRKALGR
jgi:Cupin-like domain